MGDSKSETKKDGALDAVVVDDTVVAPPAPGSSPSTMDPSDPFSYLTVGWLNKTMWLGLKRPLEYEDLPALRKTDMADNLNHVIAPWREALNKALAEQTPGDDAASDALKIRVISPLMCIFKAFWPKLVFGIILGTSATAISLFTPLVFGAIINVMNGIPDPNITFTTSGVGLVLLLFALAVVRSAFDQLSGQLLRNYVINISTVLTGAIFEKSMNLSNRSSKSFSEGRILQMVDSDVTEVAMMVADGYQALVTPAEAALTIWLLVRLVGGSIYAAAITIGAALVLCGLIMGPLFGNLTKVKTAGDKRLKRLREVLLAMKIIKMRGTEEEQSQPVVDARREQLNALFSFGLYLSLFAAILSTIPTIMPVATFVLYGKNNNGLDPAIVFPAIAYFGQLYMPIQNMPQAVVRIMQGLVSWKRIKSFLNCEERAPVKSNDDESNAVIFDSATFRWEENPTDPKDGAKGGKDIESKTESKEKTEGEAETNSDKKKKKRGEKKDKMTPPEPKVPMEPIFRDFSLKIPKGKLTAVVGPVGSGKSSLISATVGEMTKISGEVYVNGTVAMCQQQPWLLSTTIKDNILFSKPLDEAKLERTISACALGRDLDEMESGLETEIGEKGITLSGGQKARVALARAVYSDSEIFLLDDPLAALDAHVGKHVFEKCIVQELSGKSRVLITHHLHVLPHVDHIVVMKDGQVVEQGTFEEVMAAEGVLADLMKEYKIDSDSESVNTKMEINDDGAATDKQALVKSKSANALIAAEDRNRGAVKASVILAYWKLSGGTPSVILIFIFLLTFAAFSAASSIWLAIWSQQGIAGYGLWDYLHGYVGLNAAVAFSMVTFALTLIVTGYIASKNFHQKALQGLLSAPMSWFDSQPVGRIINRMTADMQTIDGEIPQVFLNMYLSVASILSHIVAIIYSAPWVVALFAILSVAYYMFMILYRSAVREVQRLESTYKSPLVSHISESVGGVSTIRAYGSALSVVVRQRKLMDESNVPRLIRMSISIWLNLRIEIFSSLIILVVGLVGVTTSTISPAFVGLALSQASDIAQIVSHMVMMVASTEASLVSIERLDEYVSKLPAEAAASLSSDPASSEWPSKGDVEIKDLVVKYASRDEPVIKGLNVTFRGGEKIGIVGRTGSGKSTLLTALFRIVEPASGNVIVDGQDVSKLGLKALRNRMQIIPQEPILFSGTIRSNIDAGGKFSDAEVWTALELVSLKDYVSELPLKLEAHVEEGGQNLSMGQRQLVILARAICHRPRILVLDEASSAVDVAADALIQKAIQTEFGGSTVISIAHRLNTVADFDKILVLDAGVMAEFDTPANLLRIEGGIFRSLVDATGTANADHIREVAEAHEKEGKTA